MKELAAIWEDINVLVPWEDNPRFNDLAIESVRRSIERFGFAAPIVARKADKMVIAGHTRLEAAKRIGLDTVPVRYLDLDPADAKMLALADNKIGEISQWDNDTLADVLKELRDNNEEINLIGWSDLELESILDEKIDYMDDESFDDDEPVISADVRQVILRLTPEEHDVFVSCVDAAAKKLGTDSVAQTVLGVLKNA